MHESEALHGSMTDLGCAKRGKEMISRNGRIMIRGLFVICNGSDSLVC